MLYYTAFKIQDILSVDEENITPNSSQNMCKSLHVQPYYFNL